MAALRHLGLPGLDPRPWGTHVCCFYDSPGDLATILVPYFRAGLMANERCLWVVSDALGVTAAREALSRDVSGLAGREERGQMEFCTAREWYRDAGEMDAPAVLARWEQAASRSVDDGYEGLRLTGDTGWIDREQWDEFMSYEALVTEAFQGKPILALCTYCMSRCGTKEVLDVFGNHHLALVHGSGSDGTQPVESRVLRVATDALIRERQVREGRDRMLGVVSHDLRNPLNVISAAAGHLAEAAHEPLTARLGHKIVRNAALMGRMVEDLLDYTRSGLGTGIPIRPTLVHPEVLCRALVEEMAVLHPDRTIQLTCEGAGVANWDPDRVKQALMNLMLNAVEHGDDPIRVRLEVARDEQLLEVWNQGPPLEAALKERVFEPFFRTDAARRQTQGLGLGLYIVRQVAEAHGGSVEVQSRSDGTVFRMRMPLKRSPEGAREPRTRPRLQTEALRPQRLQRG